MRQRRQQAVAWLIAELPSRLSRAAPCLLFDLVCQNTGKRRGMFKKMLNPDVARPDYCG